MCWACILTVNIGLHKPAYQQNTLIREDVTYDASNAVDGRKSDLSWEGGKCAISLYKQTAIWWVNLRSIHSIHHITIYFMTDDLKGKITFIAIHVRLQVYYSNDHYFEDLDILSLYTRTNKIKLHIYIYIS